MVDFIVVVDQGKFTLGHEHFPLELIFVYFSLQVTDPFLLLIFLYHVKAINQRLVQTADQSLTQLANSLSFYALGS